MTVRVLIAENPMEPGWEDHSVDDVREFLMERFAQWPDTARVYDLKDIAEPVRAAGPNLAAVLADRDVTPRDEAGIVRLGQLEGPLLVAVAPADPITAIIAAVAILVGVAAAFLLMPKIPTGNVSQSPNNQLSERTNRARPAARIPDIFGTVRAVPDLLSVPYRTYQSNQEVEISYMCVGRGSYDLSDVKEASTPLGNIAGASAIFYGPGTSPNSGEPQLAIGPAINEPVFSVVPIGEINGQTVRAPNESYRRGENDVRFTAPDLIQTNNNDAGFSGLFEPNESLVISNAGGYNGTFPILAVTNNQITLGNPGSTNASWASLIGSTGYMSANLGVSEERTVGPMVVFLPGLQRIVLNFLARGGLYSISKEKGQQAALSVEVEAELTPVNPAGDPIGPSETFSLTLTGSASQKEEVGETLVAEPTFSGRTRVFVRRVTPTDKDFDGTIVDEVTLMSGFGLAPVEQDHFGDVTTVHSRTYATSGAVSIKERRLNLLATRRVPHRQPDGSFDGLIATDRADAIMSAICVDPQIGNQPASRVDFDDIFETVARVEEYFGSDLAVRFGHTFDDDNTSFEEMLTTVARCAFCQPYRQGSTIRIAFEAASPNAALLFNHRNILPRSQEEQTRFGVTDDQDGVDLDWTDPDDAAPLTFRIPRDSSALQPRKIDVLGVRSPELAAWHAWRAWLRLVHQNTVIEQQTTQEAALVMPTDRVRITSLTREPGMEGEVEAVDGLVLTLSQPCEFEPGKDHVIYLQYTNQTVDLIGVQPEGDDPFKVRLARAPQLPLIVDPEMAAPTLYEIVAGGDRRSREFLVVEREPSENFTETIRAINYTPMYYDYDGLQLWLSFAGGSVDDASAWQRDVVQNGEGQVVEGAGGFVYQADGSGSLAVIGLQHLPVYAKAAWVNPTGTGDLLSGGNDVFRMLSPGTAQVGHGAQTLLMPLAPGWRMVSADYDGQRLTAYVDGERVAEATIARGDGVDSVAFADAAGSFGDLRLYNRPLGAEGHRALYRSTRQRYL